jgi:hypothetical protein
MNLQMNCKLNLMISKLIYFLHLKNNYKDLKGMEMKKFLLNKTEILGQLKVPRKLKLLMSLLS